MALYLKSRSTTELACNVKRVNASIDPDNWDAHWSEFADAISTNPGQIFRHRLVKKLLTQFGYTLTLTDIGCGQGDFLFSLSKNDSYKLQGVELSAAGTQISKQKVPTASVRQLDLLSQFEFPVDFTQADVLTAIEVIEHLDDPRQFLVNAQRFLKPEGYFIITVPSGPKTSFDKHIGHRRHYSPSELSDLMTTVGLDVVTCYRTGWPFFNLYRLTVMMRGKKLIADVSNDISKNRLAIVVSKIFTILLKYNIPIRRMGWQLVAVGRKTSN